VTIGYTARKWITFGQNGKGLEPELLRAFFVFEFLKYSPFSLDFISKGAWWQHNHGTNNVL
jgi:hypothetical protein